MIKITRMDAVNIFKAQLECLKRDATGLADFCDRHCYGCHLNYEKGNLLEQQLALNIAIEELSKEKGVE